jgi:ABC-2 type transport system ATP-binding protein
VSQCIEVRGIKKTYGKVTALDGVSFSIPCGERWCLLGPNGAGKSTMLKLIVGLLKPDAGTIEVGGAQPVSKEAKAKLGYLPEDATPYLTLSVRENLEYMGALRGVPDLRTRVDYLLEFLELAQYQNSKVSALSRGNRQKLALALAVIHSPNILLLDEPLNYLDIPTQEKAISLLGSVDATLLVSTHIMSIAERLTSKALIITRGKIVWSGKIEELKSLGSSDEPIESIVARIMVKGV